MSSQSSGIKVDERCVSVQVMLEWEVLVEVEVPHQHSSAQKDFIGQRAEKAPPLSSQRAFISGLQTPAHSGPNVHELLEKNATFQRHRTNGPPPPPPPPPRPPSPGVEENLQGKEDFTQINRAVAKRNIW